MRTKRVPRPSPTNAQSKGGECLYGPASRLSIRPMSTRILPALPGNHSAGPRLPCSLRSDARTAVGALPGRLRAPARPAELRGGGLRAEGRRNHQHHGPPRPRPPRPRSSYPEGHRASRGLQQLVVMCRLPPVSRQSVGAGPSCRGSQSGVSRFPLGSSPRSLSRAQSRVSGRDQPG